MDTSILLPLPKLFDCQGLAATLEEHEWKPCVALVRHGIVPSPQDKTLWASLPGSLVMKFFNRFSDTVFTLTPAGRIFFGIATRPALSSIMISLILSQVPSNEYIERSRLQSVSKELSVMESVPRPATVSWSFLFKPEGRSFPLSATVPPNPRIHRTILQALESLRRFYDLRILWPYSTRRGISSETARIYTAKTLGKATPWTAGDIGPNSVISSRDIVGYYLHYGEWLPGLCEMKQKWYPSGLTPRTYFAQGGDAIRVSTYLRDFLNEVCDCFVPTNRFDRVEPNRLVTYNNGHFFIYDLTSFTSNFHEQGPFLDALADFFRGVPICLIGPGLELNISDLGEELALYREQINTLPRYWISPRIFSERTLPHVSLIHHVAGFLGVPGNLATCTFAHGTLIGQHTDSTSRQSCAGDDGNVAVEDTRHENNVFRTITTLGIIHKEKTFITSEGSSIYLKRRFVQEGRQGVLIQRVESISLSLVNSYRIPDPRFPELSVDKKHLRKSVATSVAHFFRSLFEYTAGNYSPDELSFILSFLQQIYTIVELPEGGEVRNIVLDDPDSRKHTGVSVVFPLKREYLENDPDYLLSQSFTPWLIDVPEQTDTLISDFSGDWSQGEIRSCQMDSTLEKLVRYGWLSREQVPRKTLVGEEARGYFRRMFRDEIMSLEYTYTALFDLKSDLLSRIGVYERQVGSVKLKSSSMRFRPSVLFDPDDPVVLSLNRHDSFDLVQQNEIPFRDALGAAYLDYE